MLKSKYYRFVFLFLLTGCIEAQNSAFTILKKKGIVAAHRGGYENEYADKAPENSTANIQNAINQGFEIYESDVRRTKDGVFIIMHDATIDRTTDGTGEVKKLTIDDLTKYNLTYYNGEVSNETIPVFKNFISKGNGEIIFKIDFKVELIYLKDLIKEIQDLHLQKNVILRFSYNEKIIEELVSYKLDEIPHILFRVETLSQFNTLKKNLNPRMISIVTKENTFSSEHVQIIESASSEKMVIEAHTFNDHKEDREIYWEEQLKLPINIFHTKKPILFKAFLEKNQ